MKVNTLQIGFFCSLCLWMSNAVAIDLKFSGELVSLPCTVATEDATQTVDFEVLTTKTFYLHQRAKSKPFTLKLSECDISVGKVVEVVFSGTPSAKQKGLLALDANSKGASGVAIGLQYAGKDLALDASTGKLDLTEGVTLLNFTAFVQGDPDAIKDQTIKEGAFSAVAQFSLIYP